jgi:hypothetical protein
MKIDVHLPFPHHYKVEVAVELPSGPNSAKILFFPGGTENGGHDGVLVKVTPRGKDRPWFGIFSFGDLRGKTISGVFSCPKEDVLCVVAAGRGYMVSVNTPTETCEVPAFPITNVWPAMERALILFADFTKLVAFGRNGLTWTSKRLSWDGIEIVSVDAKYARGKGWDPSRSTVIEFTLDLSDGQMIR